MTNEIFKNHDASEYEKEKMEIKNLNHKITWKEQDKIYVTTIKISSLTALPKEKAQKNEIRKQWKWKDGSRLFIRYMQAKKSRSKANIKKWNLINILL